ncbi:hypothetical protein HG537_0A02410 [Torulaspora globosa]|uniref:Chromatin-remodeling ATPase INO80 n=1 Tax=Torulaspora globosa TaxID=48254 RepID=A0A7H9HJB7_9SACH|nr:hypothetical protein HG537_0A02410 [Torulaspora sp. CBS 2947]
MSLTSLLNKEDSETASEPMMNGKDDMLKKYFVKELNENFKRVGQRDMLEQEYQDWKFINLQEFELISEWNNQSKDWGSSDANFEQLYREMETIRDEWDQYDRYKKNKLSLIRELDGEMVEVPSRGKQKKSDRPQTPPSPSPAQVEQRPEFTTPVKRKRKLEEEEPVVEVVELKKEVENGLEEIEDEQEEVQEDEVDEIGDQEVEHDSQELKESEQEELPVDGEESSGEEQVDTENVEVEAPTNLDDDENDKDFSPDDDVTSITSSKKDKSVNMESDRTRIVRELVKMCNKNKNFQAKKRRFTSANIIDFNPLDKKLIVRITLKQMHVRRLKKAINEAKRIAAEEAAKEMAENPDYETLSPSGKRRKLQPGANGNVADGSSLTSSPTKHGLPTYGLQMTEKEARAIQRHYDNTLFAIWKDLARKDSAKIARLVQQIQSVRAANFKKTSSLCAREARKWQVRNFKQVKDFQTRARRGIREMSNFWKKNEREERDFKKKAEKEAIELARKEEEARENKRQAKKLNFLLTQTELYSHFIGRKIKTNELEGNMADHRLSQPELMMAAMSHDKIDLDNMVANKNEFHNIDFDNEDDEQLRIKAAQNASNALAETRAKTKEFDDDANGEELNFQNPTSLGEITIEQPKILACTLKEYQLKGLNWLANLYDQGINGILADEMGLGKTVQSISVLAHLAEKYNIWGPFLVVTPASTLHNWVNEISKFVPQFKILPYWGNANDRKVLRRFWDRKNFRYGKDSPFHVMITSYQMVVSDSAYLQKMKWQYMILDEAQAIKSSQSSRWKNLLSFSCRNRLLLTGTPIQNSMQELWALLHFIMPSLFDSHDEFNEWFSRDIESHAEANTKLNQQQLRRLHMILKPFMLRRVKKNVQSELGDKIEIDVLCDLTQRQAKLYQVLKSQVSTAYDVIENAAGSDEASSDQSLINTVMQFRKVCNHPDLFERADITSPFCFSEFGQTAAIFKSDELAEVFYSSTNPIKYHLPRLIYEDLILPNYHNNIASFSKLVNYTMNIFSLVNNRELCERLSYMTGLEPSQFSRIAHESIVKRAVQFHREKDVRKENESIIFEDDEFRSDIHGLYLPERISRLEKLSNITTGGVLQSLLNIKGKVFEDQYFDSMRPASCPAASAVPVSIEVLGSSHVINELNRELFDPTISQALSEISPITQYNMHIEKGIPIDKFPVSGLYPDSLNKYFSSHISMPSMDRFITESAKLKKLDELLVQLKKGGHRVLIYFQMTRMMDLMEEYLTYRRYKHIRLDGSSKLEDRRDLVHDWQTRPELFVFLLSTRAGGLGINLTAADTVIFYDSDWNPTIDSQAMDRAHRLGQTRQVTVYRLLVKGTIEERMRDRAKQKEHVQQVVMEGKMQEKKVQTVETSGEELNTKLKQ